METEPQRSMIALRAAIERRDRTSINAIAEDLVSASASLGPRWSAVIKLLARNGEWALADRAARLQIFQVSDARAAFERVALNAKAGWTRKALVLATELKDNVPSTEEVAYLRGTLSMTAGDFSKARQHFRTALEASPNSGQTLMALSAIADDGEDEKRIISSARHFNLAPVEERACYHFARGNILHRRGDYSSAYGAFKSANEAMATIASYDAMKDAENGRRAVSGWTGQRARSQTLKERAPIFVTGLPRSGTTLVEQILSAHPDVCGGGEMSLLRILAQDIGGVDASKTEAFLRAHGADRLPDLYDHLLKQRELDAPRVVDKSLDTSRYMGIALACLPNARIIWMRRSAADCAWSSYRTKIVAGGEWSHSMQSIARHFEVEDELHRFWTSLEPERILTVNYEDLVAEPEQLIRKLCDHVGLDFAPEMLQPHLVNRPVTTASVAQVREAINKGGLGAAKHYPDAARLFSEFYRYDEGCL